MNVALLLTLAAGLSAAADDAKKDLEKFQGTWEAVAFTVEGKPVPEGDLRKIKLVVKGDRSTFTFDGKTSQGTYRLDPSRKPKELDIAVTDGPDKGKTKLAIYEFAGDRLRICHGPAGGNERPKEFASKPGSDNTLEVWKRVLSD